ncbi:MAG: hypothetical protein PVG39_24205 [Desulfobacteraceae bacterium]|jgi:hypothetical protein
MLKRWLGFTILVLLIIFSNIVFADKVVERGIEYWTEADSDLTPSQLSAWMAVQPMRFVTGGIEAGFDQKPIEFGIFDLKAPDSNTLQIGFVRILMYRHEDRNKPYTLVGYTIKYVNNIQVSYKYHMGKKKYMLYDYTNSKFEHEKSIKPEEIPIIPKGKGVHA